jgi:hypothetical protein
VFIAKTKVEQQSRSFKTSSDLFQNRALLWVRNVPDSNEMWSHNFGKGQAVLDLKTEELHRGVE